MTFLIEGDPEPSAEVRRLLGFLDLPPVDGPPLEPTEIRLAAKDFSEWAARGKIEDVASVLDVRVEGLGGDIATRVYQPTADPSDLLDVVVFFHGGGWTVGDLDTGDAVARALANALGSRVVSVDYRLAPEDPFPAAFEDCMTVVRHVISQTTTRRAVIAGESAGGNLAAAVCLALRDEPVIRGQLLINPVLDLVNEALSYRRFGEGYFLTTEIMRKYKSWYLGQADPGDERISPLMASSLVGVAPAVIVTAGFDPLLDEGAAYAVRLINDSVPVTYIPMNSMLHGWLALIPNSEVARQEFDNLIAAARALFADRTP
jgi:acetyl esterase